MVNVALCRSDGRNSGFRSLAAPTARLVRGSGRRSMVCRASLAEERIAHDIVDKVVPSALDHAAAALTTLMMMADADPAAVAEAVADAPAKKSGFMSFFADGFESFLKLIDAGLANMGVPYSYGFSIIVITLLVKFATYPLSKKQVESTLSMQQLQPKVKELQTKYANDAERLQVETAKLYQTSGVNPLAGCLPTLATIPVFIGLYRALGNVADEGLLTEGFFWIPSLAGPTKLNGGLGWLVPVDGVPPLGWHDTISYLILPILLIASQYASQKIISPPQSQDPSQAQTQNILKFIPLMIGYFSLNVPSGLTLYWFTNNLVTTAQQVYLRKKFAENSEMAAATSSSGTYVAPKQTEPQKPSGKDLNARRSPKVIDVDFTTADSPTTPSQSSSRRGEKFRALKAKEAAKKEAQVTESSVQQVDVAVEKIEESSTEVNGAADMEEEVVEVMAAQESAPKGKKKSSKKKGSRKKN